MQLRALFILVLLASTTSGHCDLLVTGRIESAQTQRFITPLTNSNQQQITFIANEGTQVKPGDVVVRFDGTQADSQLRSEEEALIRAQAEADKTTAQLAMDLELAKVEQEQARVRFELAQIDAAVPADVIGDLEYSENQLALEEAEDALSEADKKLANAQQRVGDKTRETQLDIERKQARFNRWAEMIDNLELTAVQAGVVLHSTHPWNGNKFRTGDQARSGMEIATVSDLNRLVVIAWLNAVDLPRANLNSDQVAIRFDALPGVSVNGKIESVDQAGSAMPQWGNALYYRIEVTMDQQPAALLPGMSALVRIPER